MDGERPERPKGVEGVWFTDDLWRMLSQCWASQPESRPSVDVSAWKGLRGIQTRPLCSWMRMIWAPQALLQILVAFPPSCAGSCARIMPSSRIGQIFLGKRDQTESRVPSAASGVLICTLLEHTSLLVAFSWPLNVDPYFPCKFPLVLLKRRIVCP